MAKRPRLTPVIAPLAEVAGAQAAAGCWDCLRGPSASKRAELLLGWDVAIDASDMPAHADGQRLVSSMVEQTAH